MGPAGFQPVDGGAPAAPSGVPEPAQVRRLAEMIAPAIGRQAVRALGVVSELRLAGQFREAIFACCASRDAKVRSKAVLLMGTMPRAQGGAGESEAILSAALRDPDHRVRANTIEAVDQLGLCGLTEVLEARSRNGHNRERANAIKALAGLRLGEPDARLLEMLRDRRDAHRLSALWVVEKRRMEHLVEEVARIARADTNVRVRTGASATLRHLLRRMLRFDHGAQAPRAA